MFALVKNGKVVNVIKADQSFIDAATDLVAQYDYVVDIQNLSPMPGLAWDYNGSAFADNRFASPTIQQIVDKKLQDAVAFGEAIMDEFAINNILAGITQYGKTKTVTDYCHKLSHYISTGSLYAAVDEIDNMLADTVNRGILGLSPFITDDVLNYYKTKMKTYLGI